MKLSAISFKPIAHVELTDADIALLVECSEHHYDGVCKQASRIGGFLYGVRNIMEAAPGRALTFTFRELDTMAKIVEVGRHLGDEKGKAAFGLGLTLRRIMATLNDDTPDELAKEVA